MVTPAQALPASPARPPAGPDHRPAPVDTEVAHGVARQLAAANGAGAALVTGGLAAGLGNASSDIDIYLVGDQLPAGRRQLALGRRRIDVHELPLAQVSAVVQRVREADLSDEEHARPLSEADLAIAVRLHGAQVAAGQTVIGPVLDALDRGRLRKLAIIRWLGAALTALDDLAGLDRQQDAEPAVLCARTALLAAGKAVAAACGDLHDGVKWVFRQLERSAPAHFPGREFAGLVRCDPLAAGQRSLADIEALTQTCLLSAATLGWQELPLASWPAWTAGAGPLSRAAGRYPVPYDHALLAAGPGGRRLRMRHDVALVWGLCSGCSQAVVVSRATGLRGSAAAYAELTEQRCKALIARLIGAGLVRHVA